MKSRARQAHLAAAVNDRMRATDATLPADIVLLRPSAVALALGISRSSAYVLIQGGDLPACVLRGELRVRLADLRSFIEREAKPATPATVRRVGRREVEP